jgi:hypothetical protein
LREADHQAIDHANTLQWSLTRTNPFGKPEEQRACGDRCGNNERSANCRIQEIARCKAKCNSGSRANDDGHDQTLIGVVATVSPQRGDRTKCHSSQPKYVSAKGNKNCRERTQVNDGTEGE